MVVNKELRGMEWPWTMLKPVDMSATLVSNWTARWACTYVSKTTQTCFIHLRRLRQVRRLLVRDVTANLVAAITVLSRLDHCNALLAGLPYVTIAPLQRVINAAVRLVYGLHLRDHVSALRHAHNTIGNATLTTQHSTTYNAISLHKLNRLIKNRDRHNTHRTCTRKPSCRW